MITIRVSTLVKADKNKVYETIKKMEEFPKFMRNVRKLEVLERHPNRLLTLWEVEVDGAIVMWKEKDVFDDKRLRMKFKMTEGDYGSYSGELKVVGLEKKANINLMINIDWGIPSFEKIINPILKKKQKLIFKTMLIAIKNYSEKKIDG